VFGARSSTSGFGGFAFQSPRGVVFVLLQVPLAGGGGFHADLLDDRIGTFD